jgi:peroxiredoxin
MARTASVLAPLGAPAPDFSLPNPATGQFVTLGDFGVTRALLVIFLSPHCPYVKHVQKGLAKLGHDYATKSVDIVGISANDPVAYPDDAPERLVEFKRENDIVFPILFDETQEVAKAYQAACTPDFFLYDQDRLLVYRGQFDDSRPGSDVPVSGRDVRAAIDAVLSGAPVPSDQRASLGCNIKWRAGNEPEYYGKG